MMFTLNHNLFEEDQDLLMSSQVGILPNFLTNLTSLPLGCSQSSEMVPPSLLPPELPLTLQSHRHHIVHRREWGELSDCMSMKRNDGGDDHDHDHHLGISAMKRKKMKARRKVREPRFCFKTMSDVDVLDDGYKWRKYGQKVVKNTQYPRSYYRCSQENCGVKKRVERLAEDSRMVITTYEGRHIHSPSHDEEDHLDSDQLNSFFSL